jgi:hypothetical protein
MACSAALCEQLQAQLQLVTAGRSAGRTWPTSLTWREGGESSCDLLAAGSCCYECPVGSWQWHRCCWVLGA